MNAKFSTNTSVNTPITGLGAGDTLNKIELVWILLGTDDTGRTDLTNQTNLANSAAAAIAAGRSITLTAGVHDTDIAAFQSTAGATGNVGTLTNGASYVPAVRVTENMNGGGTQAGAWTKGPSVTYGSTTTTTTTTTTAAPTTTTTTAAPAALLSDSCDNFTANGWSTVNTMVADGTFHSNYDSAESSHAYLDSVADFNIATTVRTLSCDVTIPSVTPSDVSNAMYGGFYFGFKTITGSPIGQTSGWRKIGYTNGTSQAFAGLVAFDGATFTNILPVASMVAGRKYTLSLHSNGSGSVVCSVTDTVTTTVYSQTIAMAGTVVGISVDSWGTTAQSSKIDNILLRSV